MAKTQTVLLPDGILGGSLGSLIPPDAVLKVGETREHFFPYGGDPDGGPEGWIKVQVSVTRVPNGKTPRKITAKRSKAEGGGGGWLKGLPRKPRTAEAEALVAAWKRAGEKGITFPSLEALKTWAEQNPV